MGWGLGSGLGLGLGLGFRVRVRVRVKLTEELRRRLAGERPQVARVVDETLHGGHEGAGAAQLQQLRKPLRLCREQRRRRRVGERLQPQVLEAATAGARGCNRRS